MLGCPAKSKGGAPVTTRQPKGLDLRPDLVKRNFTADAPSRLWVADITYVRTRSGFVYTAFVTDAFSRKIVGWSTKSSLSAVALPMEALSQAIHSAKGQLDGPLVHHSDRGSQGGFNWLSQHPEHGGVRRWLPRTGVRRPVICRWGCGVSGVRIGRCGLRCVPRVGRFRHGRCNASSGV
ncbi:DDE-type integrase/transposase/recombinase [Corynebacterium diphtheriae]|uniref:DDE-type integrase/transposase/recombinase n=1 Tax=Corynebacterium diphtheriae TaxID=1717 RepID=UPI003B97DB3D|nr:DDE-type integrase/transposase/recombinase [Corynebacterium diphtheriae]